MIGTRFTGRLVATTDVAGVPAVIPEITGRAWITGMGQYLLDARRSVSGGFRAELGVGRPAAADVGARRLRYAPGYAAAR